MTSRVLVSNLFNDISNDLLFYQGISIYNYRLFNNDNDVMIINIDQNIEVQLAFSI